MTKKRALSERERQAMTWIRSNYRDWRKRFAGSLVEHMAERPEWVEVDVWRSWYAQPFGNNRFNVNIAIARRLLRAGVV